MWQELVALKFWADYLALGIFFGGWSIYSRAVDNYKNPVRPSLLTTMHRLRIEWLAQMQLRTLRMPDFMILTIATSNYTFFASTSILIVAGAFTLLVSANQWEAFMHTLPFADTDSTQLAPLKLLVLIVIFIYSFFTFTWSIRQINYCSILLGAAPNRYEPRSGTGQPTQQEITAARHYAETLAPSFTIAGNSFNHGLRAYYFGLALLPWFLGPLWLIASSLVIILTLWHREFSSKTLKQLLHAEHEFARALQNDAVDTADKISSRG